MHNPFNYNPTATTIGKRLLSSLRRGTYRKLQLPLHPFYKAKKCSTKKMEPGIIFKQKKSTYIIVAENNTGYQVCEGFIKVQTNCMSPMIKKNAWVGIRRLKYKHLTIPGNEYIVITKDLRIHLGRLMPLSTNTIKMEGATPGTGGTIILLREIKAVLLVEFVLSFPKPRHSK